MYKSYCSDVTDEEYLNWKSHNADYVAFVMPAGQLKEQIQLFHLAAVFRSG